MRNLRAIFIVILCFIGISRLAYADSSSPVHIANKQRIELMLLHMGPEDQAVLGVMESALIQDLQQKYEVVSGGPSVPRNCEDNVCRQQIAIAALADLIAITSVAKQTDGHVLSLSIQNPYDGSVIYSNSVTCKACDANQLVEKLKVLASEANVAPSTDIKSANTETVRWYEIRNANTLESYLTYLSQFPGGKYIALANGWIAKLKEEAAIAARRAEDASWKQVQGSEDIKTVQGLLDNYPGGSHAALARDKLDAMRKLEAELKAGRVFRDCADCPEMVVVPAGGFEMGGAGPMDGHPVHHVTLAQPFAMGKIEVTQGQWRALMGNNPSKFSGCGDACPVEQVSWNEAQEFIRKLNAKTGKIYRLPSEAEWEYACRGGESHAYCGSESEDDVAWYRDNSRAKTHPAGQKQANALGLYDMGGNVAEWVEDNYHETYDGAPVDGSAWLGEDPHRVLRGSSWGGKPQSSGVAKRGRFDQALRGMGFGFRLVRVLP